MSNKAPFVRGASVNISVKFTDLAGAVITSGISNASLRIAYYRNGVKTIEVHDLVNQGSGNWSYDWASDIADAGQVFWWAQSADQPKSAIDGEFDLEANAASLQA